MYADYLNNQDNCFTLYQMSNHYSRIRARSPYNKGLLLFFSPAKSATRDGYSSCTVSQEVFNNSNFKHTRTINNFGPSEVSYAPKLRNVKEKVNFNGLELKIKRVVPSFQFRTSWLVMYEGVVSATYHSTRYSISYSCSQVYPVN